MKPEIIFIFSDCIGGVASFNRNLINYSSIKVNSYVKVILLRPLEDSRKPFIDHIDADEVINFNFSNLENQYFVCKKLSLLIGKKPGCIVSDNDWALKAVSIFPNQKKVIYVIHDYFYINWALTFSNVIDHYVAHSSFFKEIMLAADYEKFQNRVAYIPYGVYQPIAQLPKQKEENHLKLIFLGRLVESKGVMLLRQIEDILFSKNVEVQWTILGVGSLKVKLVEQWQDKENVVFVEAKDTEEVYYILSKQDVLVFPSKFEGTPVSIMEAISSGLVPVVSDLPGGTRDMVTIETGYRCDPSSAIDFANAVEELHLNRKRLKSMQTQCILMGKNSYDIKNAADSYFNFFEECIKHPSSRSLKKTPLKLNALDRRFIPNYIVKNIRKIKNIFK